jgi:hypothetical protein
MLEYNHYTTIPCGVIAIINNENLEFLNFFLLNSNYFFRAESEGRTDGYDFSKEI